MPAIINSQFFRWSCSASFLTIIAYALTWWFYAMWWFVIMFIDFAFSCLYSIVTLGSIVFYIRNFRKIERAFVPLIINLLTVVVVSCCPSINRNKSYPKQSIDLSKNQGTKCACHLYREDYCVFAGGATTTDLDAVYLTDLKNFRVYIGVFDEAHQHITIRCDGDHIAMLKTGSEEIDTMWTAPVLLERQSYSLKILAHDHSFQ